MKKVKVLPKRNGLYAGHYYFAGKEAVLPEDALKAIKPEHFKVLETIDDPEKDEKKETKAVSEAVEDKQIKQAVVNK